MSRALFLIFFMCCIARLAQAETVVVRSADHIGFTRIALDLARPETVSVAEDSDGLVVQLPENTRQTNAAGFFNRITRERVQAFDIEEDEKELKIGLACDCAFTTFIAGAKTFVIDIQDAPTRARSEVDVPLDSDAGEPNQTFQSTLDSEVGGGGLNQQLPEMRTRFEGVGENAATMRLHDALDDALDVNALFQAEKNSPSQTAPAIEQIAFRSLALSKVQSMAQIEANTQPELFECGRFSAVDPLNWPKYDDAREFLAMQRNGILERYEDFNDGAARQLALSYLSLAMGAEARSILRAIQDPNEADQYLMKIAEFIDDEQVLHDHNWLEVLGQCSELAIWKILKQATNPTEKDAIIQLNREELLAARQGFERWPSALKGVFAPLLAEALFEQGARDEALFALRKTQGKPARRSGDREMVQASMSESQGSNAEAIDVLTPVARSDLDNAPEAVISLANLAAQQGQKLGAPEQQALEIYQEELKGTALEPDLLRARIISALQDEAFETAIALIDEYSDLVRASKANLVIDELGEAVFAIAGDAMFLKEAVSLPNAYFRKVNEATQEQIRTRVHNLGFEELAQQLGKPVAREAFASSSDDSTSSNSDSEQAEQLLQNAQAAESTEPQIENVQLNDAQAPPQQNPTALARAITETQSVLSGMNALRDSIADAGL